MQGKSIRLPKVFIVMIEICSFQECLKKFKARDDIRRHVLGSVESILELLIHLGHLGALKTGSIFNYRSHADRPCYFCSVCSEKFTSEMLGTSHKQKFHNREATIRQVNNEYTKELVESLTRLIEATA